MNIKKHSFLVSLTLIISSVVASDHIENAEVTGTDGWVVTGMPYKIQSKNCSDLEKGGYLVSEHLKDKHAISTSEFLPQKSDGTEVSDHTGEWYIFEEGKGNNAYEIRNRQLYDNENPSALCIRTGFLKSVKIYEQNKDKKKQYISWHFSPTAPLCSSPMAMTKKKKKSFEITSNNCGDKGKSFSLSCNKNGKVGMSEKHDIETSWYLTPTIKLSEPVMRDFVFNDGKDITQMIEANITHSKEVMTVTFENGGNKCSKTFKLGFEKTTEKSWNFKSSKEVNFSKKIGFGMRASLPGVLVKLGIPVNFSIKVGVESDYKEDSSSHEERYTYEKEKSTFEEEFTTDVEPNETVTITSVYSQLETIIPFTANIVFTAKVNDKCISAVGVKSLLLHEGYLGETDKMEEYSVYAKINGSLSLQHSYDFKAVKKSNLTKPEIVLPVSKELKEPRGPLPGLAIESPKGTPEQTFDTDSDEPERGGPLQAAKHIKARSPAERIRDYDPAFTTPTKAKQNSTTAAVTDDDTDDSDGIDFSDLSQVKGLQFSQPIFVDLLGHLRQYNTLNQIAICAGFAPTSPNGHQNVGRMEEGTCKDPQDKFKKLIQAISKKELRIT